MPPDLRRFEAERGILRYQLLNLREPEEVSQRHQLARHRPALQLLPVQSGQEVHQVVAAHTLNHKLSFSRKLLELVQIPLVRGDSIRRQPFLDSYMHQKRRNNRRYFHQLSTYAAPSRPRLKAMP